MRTFFISLFTVSMLSISLGFAQRTDELKQKLAEADTDTTKVKLLARLGFEYAFIDLDTSRQYCNKSIVLAKQIGFIRGQADATNNLAISYDVEGNHEFALEFFLSALDLYEKIDSKVGLARVYNNCGMVYQSLDNLPKSLEFHTKSLGLEKEIGDSIGVAYSEIHLAAIYVDLDSVNMALMNYLSAKAILEDEQDSNGLSYVYTGLGELYFNDEKYERALPYLEKSFELFTLQENKKGISEALLLIGKAQLEKSNYVVAEEKLLGALEKSKELNTVNIVSQSLSNLSTLYKRKGQYEIALSYFEKYTSLQDSIQREEMTSNVVEIQSKYDFEKQSRKLLLLNTEQAFQTKIRNIFIGVLIVFAVLLVLLFRMYLFKSKALTILKGKNSEIRRKNKLIEIEKKNAMEAAQVKSDFLSVMSHEIRTPMNAIVGSTHLLLNKNPKQDQIENLNILKFSSDNLLVLLNDILDINKLESDKMDFESVRFNLSQLTQGLVGVYRKQAESKSVDFILEMHEKIPIDLVGDPGRLFQVLNNLISNAIKFTEEGHVKLSIALVSINRDKVTLKFCVEDSGIGIEHEKIDMVFDSFSQADSNTTRKYGGTGLGLSITKRILELLGSEIRVESEPHVGSKFYFELSLNIYSGFEFESDKMRAEDAKKVAIEGMKVLVVDDNKTNLLITKSILNKWKVTPVLVESAAEALVELSKGRFDIVLMDLRMPEMDGYKLTEKIRSEESENTNVPIVAVSANVSDKIRESVLKQGMNDYLAKPFDPSKLLNIIYEQTVDDEDQTNNQTSSN